MIQSMTAFGRAVSAYTDGVGSWLVEIKCVNSKFLDYQPRLPALLNSLEERIKKYVAAKLSRGRVSVFVTLNGVSAVQQRLSLNLPLLEEYKKIIKALQEELHDSFEKPNLGFLLNNRDLMLSQEDDPDMEQIWESLEPALNDSLREVLSMRKTEGAYLADDLQARLDILSKLVDDIEQASGQIVEQYKQRLYERIAKLLDNIEIDQERLAHEVAINADKCDISEELVRARSHLSQFRKFLQSSEPVGRKLDFLVQELNREANTMGSKSPDARALNLVVEMKAELERIREQVQNIE